MPDTSVIAIVDDDASVRDALGRLVRSFGLDVELYSSAQALLDVAALDHIACVISDVQMHTMNGFALCDALRARGFAVPVIFMTGFVREGYEARARASGATWFLNKPFEDTEMLRCIEQALMQPRQMPRFAD